MNSNYSVTSKLYENVNTVIYRGQDKESGRSVVIKTVRSSDPTQKEIARLRHEYELSKDLNIKGVVKPYALEAFGAGEAMTLEDFDGESLRIFLSSRTLTIKDFLAIAIQLAETLGELHQKNIIHKDIKPQNIIINVSTGQVKITDFSIASRLSRENQVISNLNLLEGTLAYMSPEQTGRMNRSLDYRTDFYSLGVTFYEMLTGQLPYTVTDAMELVHCHIAKNALPPNTLNAQIPHVLSAIVMKLLAKTAEDRYQSAYGIKVDLETCLKQLETTGVVEDFTLGLRDISAKFQIPQKLYGREQEVAVLLAAFDRVADVGNSQELYPTLDSQHPAPSRSELMLVAGYSGIGKSALVNEIHKPVVRQRGYFIAGKFDQFKRNIPYASLIQAFQELIRQILTESEAQIQVWKEKLITALNPNGQVIIDVIPEVELIIGSQPAVPQLGSSESQNRFNLVFQQFLSLFAQKEHPLVLFLDDLQWADSASLKLLQLLMTASDQQCLLLIGAYRDNEVNLTHPLMLALEDIQNAGTVVNTITLAPLAVDDVNQLVADTLHSDTAKSRPLAELLLQKTGGNPFFLTQMLSSLHQEKLLSYNVESGQWQWTLEQIQQVGITDNVVELMVGKLQKLPDVTQNALKLAACIGSTFNLNLLAIVNEKPLSTTAGELWEALQCGLVLPLSDTYKLALVDSSGTDSSAAGETLEVSYRFLHDRVQQAAYFLIPEEGKKETHLKVGRLLLKYTKPAERDEKIFDLVNQLNIGIDLITDQIEGTELAALNLLAGRKAKAATAYEPALKYLTTGLDLLAEDSWQSQYELASALHIETVEVEYLNTHFERAEQLTEVVLEHTQDLLQKVKVYQTKIYFNIARNQMLDAIATSLQVLDLLGESLTQEAPQEVVVEDLIHLLEMSDPYKLAAMEILITLLTPCLNAKPELLPAMSFTLASLAMRHGNSSFAAMGYALYGLILCGGLNRIEEGYRFGQLGLKLQEQFHAKELEAKVINIFNVFIRHWKEPAKTTISPLLAGIQAGLNTGDVEYACYNSTSYCNYLFFVGEPLSEVNQKQAKYVELLLSLKQEYQIYFTQIVRQLVLNLLDDVSDRTCLVGESFDELKMVPIFVETKMGTLLFLTYLAKTILLYILKDYRQALAYAQSAEPYHGNMVGFMQFVEYNFYYSLSLLAVYESASTEEKAQYLEKVNRNQSQLKQWAFHAPENYQHKYDLVEAEKARVLSQVLEAMAYYDGAIKAAREQGYVHEEAIANEAAATFYHSQRREEIAHLYLMKAHRSYARWGAIAKVNELEATHPKLCSQSTLESSTMGLTHSRTASTLITGGVSALDLTTIVKASQAIAGEIVLSKLLDKLLTIVMENAGAQTSCLILERAGQLMVEATGSVDRDEITVWQPQLVSTSQQLPVSVINYVARTQETLVLKDATQEEKFARDPYIVKTRSKSILCTPIINKGKLIGLLYLENNLTTGAFTPERLEILKLLSSQAAISLENALLYSNLEVVTQDLQQANVQLADHSRTLEQKVEQRTLELQEKNGQLESTLNELKQTQIQLIQTEKMSSLGQLVAGVAHEINNPVNFIHGNLTHASCYTNDLLELIQRYRQHYPHTPPELQNLAEEMDLEFLIQDLPKILNSMRIGADRIRQIVLSLRNFSRLDESDMKSVNIHEGIESTLLLLQHRLQRKGSLGIEVVKEYGDLPFVECYVGQLNQVFMNIFSNAIDALEGCDQRQQACELLQRSDRSESVLGIIRICTETLSNDWVRIRVIDNGIGMSEDVRSKLFDPFFTTKPVGAGTGMGLSISYQIVANKHNGHFRCESAPGQGAAFIVEIPVRQKYIGD
ncbi:trifunctional serine/threonine-protein kinase/ATP-binding protein/sensor histidine kinase [Trichocoleus desertorum AS-A10]|uniref:trifunctional serine/threonine-protein kinase/ATP-binding protein/sensor histidine kinase n=1 Tax=Trichocoleus desertorum TaxID=1481672 RepID=UPI00329714F1